MTSYKLVTLFFLILVNVPFLSAGTWVLDGATNNLKTDAFLEGEVWVYRDGKWLKKEDIQTNQLTEIYKGEGFWHYISLNNINKDDLKIDTGNYVNWHSGWNLVTPVFRAWDLNTDFGNHIKYSWRYEDGEWKLFSPSGDYGFPTFRYVDIGKGVWIYIDNLEIMMSGVPILCKDGVCPNIDVPTNNFVIKLKAPQSKSGLKIGIKMQRDGSDTIYRFGTGPFAINSNGSIENEEIAVCVESSASGGVCKKEFSTSFLDYKDGYIVLDGVSLAKFFEEDKPDIVDKLTGVTGGFSIGLYTEGIELTDMNYTGTNFGTIGIDGFGTFITIGDYGVLFHTNFY